MVQGSEEIVAWAQANPAGAAAAARAPAQALSATRVERRPTVTVEDLERWDRPRRAVARARVSDERAVVELCTCYGEPVDVVESGDR